MPYEMDILKQILEQLEIANLLEMEKKFPGCIYKTGRMPEVLKKLRLESAFDPGYGTAEYDKNQKEKLQRAQQVARSINTQRRGRRPGL